MSRMTERQLAKAYVAEKTLEHTHRYLLEGRHYADCSDEEVTDLWVVTFRDLAGTNFSQELQRAAILDIESELGLRRIEMPLDQVQPELALFSKYVERRRRESRPDPADCAEFRAELADLRERLSRPKH
jgi:hypothetical protein